MTVIMSSRGTYQIKFSGETIITTVTDRASDADNWIRSITAPCPDQRLIVGLDCEWKPRLIPDMSNTTATLQLCVGTRCLILQLFHMDYIPLSIKNFLVDPNHLFVRVEVDENVFKLEDEYGIKCSRMGDIRGFDRYPWMFTRMPKLKELSLKIDGLVMLKPLHVCKSNWQARVLSFEQVEYACIDAYCCYRIGKKLLLEFCYD